MRGYLSIIAFFILLLASFIISLYLVGKPRELLYKGNLTVFSCEKLKTIYENSNDKEIIVEAYLNEDCEIDNYIIPKGERLIKIRNKKIDYI